RGWRRTARWQPGPPIGSAKSGGWPRARKVPSTTVMPGSRSSHDTTSRWRTGTCGLSALGFTCETLRNIFHAPLRLVDDVRPVVAVPDLEVLSRARHHDLAVEVGVLHQRRRQRDAALLVGRRLVGRREEEAAHRARLAGEAVQPVDLLQLERLPSLEGERPQAPVQPAGDHDPGLEARTELGRHGEPVLLVEALRVLAE